MQDVAIKVYSFLKQQTFWLCSWLMEKKFLGINATFKGRLFILLFAVGNLKSWLH
jgi:hypothetical protein